MQTVDCANCGDRFEFDPKTVWTSPGTLQGPQPGIPPAVVIRCPKCLQWIRVELDNGEMTVVQGQS